MSYVLIIPMKDEEEALPRLKETIFKQTARPSLSVIVDSGSEDASFQLANSLFRDYSWVHVIKQTSFQGKGYNHKNIAQACNEGYTYAKRTCEREKIEYSFVGRTDTTPVLSRDYFEILIDKIHNDTRCAFVCGSQRLLLKNSIIDLNSIKNITLTGINGVGIFRREFFEEVKGYPLSFSPETVILAKALSRGWNVKAAQNATFIKPRLGGSKIGLWKGYGLKGKAMYALGYHPLLVLLNTWYQLLKFPPHYQAFPMILGYLQSSVVAREATNDNELKEYFGKKRLKEVIHGFFSS